METKKKILKKTSKPITNTQTTEENLLSPTSAQTNKGTHNRKRAARGNQWERRKLY